MALNFAEFKAALAEDKARLDGRKPVRGMLSCTDCDTPLQESVTGSRSVDDGQLCSDCYFERFGRELDGHPSPSSVNHSHDGPPGIVAKPLC